MTAESYLLSVCIVSVLMLPPLTLFFARMKEASALKVGSGKDRSSVGEQFHILSDEEAEAHTADRKARLGLVPWDQFDSLSYPQWVTAVLDHFAVGEGHVLAVSMRHVNSGAELRERLVADFGPFLAKAFEAAPGLQLLPVAKRLLSDAVVTKVQEITGRSSDAPRDFEFSTRLQVNYA